MSGVNLFNEKKDIGELFKRALAYYQNGNIEKSRHILCKILEVSSDHTDSYHLLGLIESQSGNHDIAISKLSLAVQQCPNNPEYAYNYGYVLQAGGYTKRAIDAYCDLIKQEPGHIESHYNLGILYRDLGNIGEAVRVYNRLVEIKPDFPQGHCELGNVLSLAGQYEDAIASYKRAIALSPTNCIAYYNLAIAYRESGMFKQALSAVDKAIECNPSHAEAYIERGTILMLTGDVHSALDSFTAAVQHAPHLAKARSNRGRALFELGRIKESLLAYSRAINQDPGLAEAHCGLGNVLMAIGQPDEAINSFSRALEIRPDYSQVHSNLLFLHAAQVTLPPSEMLYEQKQWDVIHCEEGRKNRFPAKLENPKTSRRIRIGYVSADLYRHPVSYFFEPLLSAHDTSRFEIFCYDSKLKGSDEVTERLRSISEHWQFVANMSDFELAKLIYNDKIDILVDLTGHFEGGRLKAFSYKPAPVQASYLGYIAATGLEAIDYWITDTVLHPEGTEEQTVGNIYRLPRCAYCYLPPNYAPAVTESSEKLPLTFGSFANLSKISNDVTMVWGRLLKSLPESQLVIMDRAFQDPEICSRITGQFINQGVAENQIKLLEAMSHEEYLKIYSKIDIVLDTFPRTGGTTTAEALWMGVPVITKAGKRYVERISASKLSALGLDELIGVNIDEYLRIAVTLAKNPDRLRKLKQGIRKRFIGSALFDGVSLARAVEAAYINMLDLRDK